MPLSKSPVGGRYPESGNTAIKHRQRHADDQHQTRDFRRIWPFASPFVANVRFCVVSWVENRRGASIWEEGGRGFAIRDSPRLRPFPDSSRSCPHMPFQLPDLPYRQGCARAAHVGRDARISSRQASQGLCRQDQRADRRRPGPQRRLAHRGRPRSAKVPATASCSTTARSCGTTASSGNASRPRRASSPTASSPS